jgi:hypothetical protein
LRNAKLQRDESKHKANIAEYEAVVLLLRSLFAYHAHSEPSKQVTELSTLAIDGLRQMLVPPTTQPVGSSPIKTKSSLQGLKPSPLATNRKAPTTVLGRSTSTATANPAKGSTSGLASRSVSASHTTTNKTQTDNRDTLTLRPQPRTSLDSSPPIPRFEDLPRLSKLLSALISLLGMLGHSLAKINALKVLRALLRHHPDQVDEYVSYSAELATEYMKLGKNSRAGSVFAQIFKTISEREHGSHGGTSATEGKGDKKSVRLAVVIDAHLRYSEFLTSMGQVEQG